ncbi:SDR family oxidoreductase [Uliginosibacterium gangwonense]|uniref:SDR family oxidoreductase n=1 Tax=Uliginosibacterium gangwonense TaxID=392736 RepID=UPI00035CC5C1|nr:SDR family NAD(P)-dependent oxidoreductase [Uliginosibacterium gangwonense]
MTQGLLPLSLNLDGRIVLLTGATGGLGAAIAHILATRGAQLVLAGRNGDALAHLQATLAAHNIPALGTLIYDLQDDKASSAALQDFARQYKRLDVLINAAGIMIDAPLGMIGSATIQQSLQINLTATLNHMQYAARLMTRQGAGCIINIASIVGITGSANQVLYAASKSAVIGATKSAAKELAPKGIRVNAVAPGFIDTALTAAYKPEQRERIIANIGMGRAGTPEEVAEVIAFLASDASRYITGQVIGIDGGMVL